MAGRPHFAFANRSGWLGRRAGALAIDACVVIPAHVVALAVVNAVAARFYDSLPSPWWPWQLANGLLTAAVLTMVWSLWRGPGAAASGLRIVDGRTWRRPGWWRLLIRAVPTVATVYAAGWLGLLLLFAPSADFRAEEGWAIGLAQAAAVFGALLLPYLPVACTSSGRSAWDMLSGTRVVDSR